MKIYEEDFSSLFDALNTRGLKIRIPPYDVRLRCQFDHFARDFALLYADYEIIDDESAFMDLEIDVLPAPFPKRLWRKQARFSIAGTAPFNPLPQDQAFPMFEWGLNWCVTNYLHTRLSIHAAAIARGDHAVIMPGSPGSGKSTLCAASMKRDFTLLSDELSLIDLDTLDVLPIPARSV